MEQGASVSSGASRPAWQANDSAVAGWSREGISAAPTMRCRKRGCQPREAGGLGSRGEIYKELVARVMNNYPETEQKIKSTKSCWLHARNLAASCGRKSGRHISRCSARGRRYRHLRGSDRTDPRAAPPRSFQTPLIHELSMGGRCGCTEIYPVLTTCCAASAAPAAKRPISGNRGRRSPRSLRSSRSRAAWMRGFGQ